MKKSILLFASILMLAVVGCSKDEIDKNKDDLSKTKWTSSQGDKVLVFEFLSSSDLQVYFTSQSGDLDGNIYDAKYSLLDNNITFTNATFAKPSTLTSYKAISGVLSGSRLKVEYQWSVFGGEWHDSTETFMRR